MISDDALQVYKMGRRDLEGTPAARGLGIPNLCLEAKYIINRKYASSVHCKKRQGQQAHAILRQTLSRAHAKPMVSFLSRLSLYNGHSGWHKNLLASAVGSLPWTECFWKGKQRMKPLPKRPNHTRLDAAMEPRHGSLHPSCHLLMPQNLQAIATKPEFWILTMSYMTWVQRQDSCCGRRLFSCCRLG